MTTDPPDRLATNIRLMLVILGAVLCVIGFFRYFAG
jgi:hypothetical protein